MPKDLVEQLKQAHRISDVDFPNKKVAVTMFQWNASNPRSSFCQIRKFARKKEDEKFQQIVYVYYKLEKFNYPLDVMNSV